MKKKVVVILILTALIVAGGVVFAGPGEDSDKIQITKLKWETPHGKEGGDEGMFQCFNPGEDSD